MPRKPARKDEWIRELSAVYRKIMRNPNSSPVIQLRAADRIAVLLKLLDIRLNGPNVSSAKPVEPEMPEPTESDENIKKRLEAFQQSLEETNGKRNRDS